MDVHDNSWMALIVRYANNLRTSTPRVERMFRSIPDRASVMNAGAESPKQPEG